MGILNVTPDSFSDGGMIHNQGQVDRDRLLKRVADMVEQGAEIIDVGGESTRPGASPVSPSEEMDRVIPALEWIKNEFDVCVSVDTSTPELMEIAANKGAALLNDVRSFQRPAALETAAAANLPVCLMHMGGEPTDMQVDPQYDDVVEDVCAFLDRRASDCVKAGIPREHIIVDPGFGFGKALDHNIALFKAIPLIKNLGFPVLAGVSRKRMIGAILNKPVDERLHGSVAMSLLAAQQGARILRVHDVGATCDAVKVWWAVR
ncbi:MAG: dihydropteroate synthase [bacterium]